MYNLNVTLLLQRRYALIISNLGKVSLFLSVSLERCCSLRKFVHPGTQRDSAHRCTRRRERQRVHH